MPNLHLIVELAPYLMALPFIVIVAYGVVKILRR